MSTSATQTPSIVERPSQPYAAIRRRVSMAELGEVLPPLNGQVFGWLTTHGGTPSGAPFWRYLVIDMATALEMEVGVGTTTVLEPDGDVIIGELPAGRYACLRHVGHPRTLMQATADVLAWAEREGVRFDHQDGPDGDAWGCRLELYLTDPDTEPDLDKWVAELAVRLAD